MLKSLMSPARTRMAPSPTGELHIGGLRTALYDYALARQTGGQFILRIEDTDQKRFVPGSDTRIISTLQDYGLTIDEGPIFQTQRLDIYQEHIQQLLDQGHAYYCFCSEDRLKGIREVQKANKQIPRYDRHCLGLSPEEVKAKITAGEKYVIRMKIPDNEVIIHHDLVRGQVRFNTKDIDDQVLIKSNGIPTYHFAVVVDDHLMNITHVFRAEEWLPSVPKHILLYRYFGWDMPQHAHLSVFLDPSHSGKMSKRHGSVSAKGFLDDGYLPSAVLNFIMLLGWNPGTDKEIYSLDEFVNDFSLDKLNKKPAVFDRQKLDYFNGHYIRQLSSDQLFSYFKKFLPQASDDQVNQLIPILHDRIVKFSDLSLQTKFLFEDVDYSADLLLQRGADRGLVIDILTKSKDLLTALKTFNFQTLQTDLMDLIKSNSWNIGQFFMILRVAICGVAHTPPLVECLPILGRENTLRKIDLALAKLK